MVVKVFIHRRFKEGHMRACFALLNKMRADAMDQPGYISGETLFDYEDPQSNMVVATWSSVENWLAWKNNPDRGANEKILERYMEGPTTYNTYVFGTYLMTGHEKKHRQKAVAV